MARIRNYLRTYRKRTGLTQAEVAFVLGTKSGTRISRYERFGRQPRLETALAYEELFRIPAAQLFAGMSEDVVRAVRARAQKLAMQIEAQEPSALTRQKLEALRRLAEAAQ